MHTIVFSQSFEKRLDKFIKRNKALESKMWTIFNTLEKDLFYSTLHTHKLSGKLADYHACTISYDYRLVFKFDNNYIYPHAIGNHNQIY